MKKKSSSKYYFDIYFLVVSQLLIRRLYHLQVYFTRMKFNFTLMKLNFTKLKLNFTNIKIIFTKVKFNFAQVINFTKIQFNFTPYMYNSNSRHWKWILLFWILNFHNLNSISQSRTLTTVMYQWYWINLMMEFMHIDCYINICFNWKNMKCIIVIYIKILY